MHEIRQDYNLCVNNPEKYRKKVDEISSIFGLCGVKKLAYLLPDGITGKYDRTKQIVCFGINPAYPKTHDSNLEEQRRKSWADYERIQKERFSFPKDHGPISKYYDDISILLTGLIKNKIEENIRNREKILYDHLTNVNLIPYRSNGISIPTEGFSICQLNYMIPRLYNIIKSISKYNPKLFIFNGKPWYTLLIKHHLIKKDPEKEMIKKFGIYFFKMDDIPCVLFDKFFSAPYWGLLDNDKGITMPNIIKKYYPDLF